MTGKSPSTERVGAPVAADNTVGLAYVFDWFKRYWLAVWFLVIDIVWLAELPFVGTDGTYFEAARRLWAGEDPWATSYNGWYFAAPPTTLLPLLPVGLIPEGVANVILVAIAVAASVWTVRHLALPWYWLAFPPLFFAMLGGAFDTWLAPLILMGLGWWAPFAKIYAVVPLAIRGEWRQLAIFAIALAVTFPFLPWPTFLDQFPTIREHLAMQAGRGPGLIAIPIIAVALVLMGRERAAWMAVPALWPSTQFYYGAMAVPALTPWAAAVMAVPSDWSPTIACCVLAASVIQSRLGQDGSRLRGLQVRIGRSTLYPATGTTEGQRDDA